MSLPDNPIFKRLIMTRARPLGHFVVIGLALYVNLIVLFFFLNGRGWLDSFMSIMPIFAFPAVLLSLFVIAGSAAFLVTRESRGEAFQLIRLTNMGGNRVVWGYVGGIIFRTRHYIILYLIALPLTTLGTFIEVRRDVPYSVSRSIFYEPSVFEAITLFSLTLILTWCSVFAIITSGINHALRTHHTIRATITAVFVNGSIFLGIIGLLILLIMSETSDMVSIYVGFILTSVPYLIALLFAQQWQSDLRTLAPVLNIIPFTIAISIYFLLGGLSYQITIIFGVIFLGIAGYIVYWIIVNPNSRRVPIRIGFLAWQAMMGSLLLIGMESDYAVVEEVMLWMVIINLWLMQVGFGLQELKRAQRHLWDERHYF